VSRRVNIKVAQDGNLPIIIGDCPACHNGENTMVLVDYTPNRNPDNGVLKLRCLVCSNIHVTKICEVTEE